MLNTVVVGSIGAPHGVRGWVRVNSFTDPSDNLFNYPLLIEKGQDNWQPVEIEQVQPQGRGFIAKLVGVQDRDQAALITNAKLAVLRDALPELDEDENYWADIIGLEVYNQDQVHLGTAVDFFDNGANEVLVVKGESEHLIPYVPEMYIVDVDLEARRIDVNWDLDV